jgi:hypothetical protein
LTLIWPYESSLERGRMSDCRAASRQRLPNCVGGCGLSTHSDGSSSSLYHGVVPHVRTCSAGQHTRLCLARGCTTVDFGHCGLPESGNDQAESVSSVPCALSYAGVAYRSTSYSTGILQVHVWITAAHQFMRPGHCSANHGSCRCQLPRCPPSSGRQYSRPKHVLLHRATTTTGCV